MEIVNGLRPTIDANLVDEDIAALVTRFTFLFFAVSANIIKSAYILEHGARIQMTDRE